MYTIPDVTYTGKSFTISADVDQTVSFDMSVAHAIHGAKVSFNNVTFDYKTNNNYIGLQHADTLTYNGCTINGMVFLYATNETFNGCTFNQTSKNAYNVWTYGAKNVAFNQCVFNSAGKSVLVYNEGANPKTDLTVSETKFVASEKVDGKAAIEIDTSRMAGGTTITIDDKTTATDFAEGSNSGSTLWNDKKQTADTNKNTTITVADEVVYAPYVAAIGEVKYFSLTAAIAAAKDGETVKLLADATEDVVVDKNITLDLGGKTLTGTKKANTASLTVVKGATATVKNGTIFGTANGYYTIQNNGTATFESLTATAGNTGSSMIDNWGTLTITSGTYTGGLNVVKSEEDSVLTINGGKFTLDYSTDGYTGVIFAYGDTTITGGEFIQSLTTCGRWKHPQVILTGVVEGHVATTKVTGGSFTNAHSDEGIFRGVGKGTSDNFEVSGGTFNKSVSEEYCANGFIPTRNADGTYGVKEGKYVAKIGSKKYETLADAIRLAAKGKTVTLLDNISGNFEIASTKKITLDLNGFTLNGGTGTAKAAITNYGTLTITDSSEAKTGTIKRADNGVEGETSYYVIQNLGTMTIEQANVVNNSGYKKTNPSGSMVGSSLICNGDNDEGASLTINGGKLTQLNFLAIKNGANGTLVVNGGEITSEHSAIQNWFNATITGGTIKGQLWTDAYKAGESVGNTKIGGNVQFEGEIVMDVWGSISPKPELTINGGKLSVTNWRITTACAKLGGKPAVQGGTFTNAVPAEYCAEGFIPQDNGDGTFGVKEGTYVAEVNGVKYETLQAAFDAAKTGDTVKLLTDITLTAQVNITKALNGLTLDGNGKTITCATTTDVFTSGGSALYFGNATDKLYCTGIKIKDLTMTGKARFAIFLCGGTTTEFTNVNISGEYYIAVNLYGTHGATMTNCTISNSTIGTDEYISGVWSNVASANPLRLVSTTVDVIAINAYTTANTLAPKIFIDKNSSAEVHTFDDGSVSYNKKLCVSTESEGSYTVKEYFNSEWVDTYVAEVKGVKYETLQAAIDDAAPRNAIVTLLANTRENVTIAKAYLTLDLNGYTINGGTEQGKPAVTVTARVTIKDSSAAQTGTIMREDTAENSGKSSHYVIDIQGDGWLTFESGKVINNSGNKAGNGASLVRVGDDRFAKYPGLNIKGGTFTQNNFIVIKVDRGDLFLNGGTLNSANSYAIENWHRATVKGGTVNGAVSSWTYSGGLNSDLTISGGTINGNVESVTYDEAAGKLAKVSITGGTVTGMLSHSVYGQSGDADKAKATIEVSGGTFSIDPSKYVVEESAITENADGTFGVKKAYLVRVGNTSYYTMDEAFKAQTASGEAIVMLRDYTTGSTFNSGTKHRVVDLNGHTWTYTGTDMNSAAFEINNPNTTLTVKNGTIISSTIVGLIPSASAMGGTITYDNAGLVFEKVEMTSNGSSGIETNGNNTNDSVTLINSTLNVPNGFGIYFPSSGTLTIDNSKINAKTMGVQVCSGELNINAGSAITVTGDAVTKTENDGAIQDGAAISIVNRTGYKGLSNIVITGGTFTAKAGNDAIKAYDWNNAENKGSDFTKADLVAVSGGTFSSEVNKDYLADGFVINQNENKTYGVREGSGFAGANVVVTESLAMKVTIANGTASKYVVVTYKGLDGDDKSVKLDTLTDGYYLFNQIMPQMIDVKFSFELYGENDVMLDRKANYSVVDYLADIIASEKDSAEFRNVAASLIEYANRAKTVKGLATIAPEFVKGTEKVDLTELYKTFIADEKNKIPAKDTVKAEDISNGDAQVIYKAKVVFDDAYTLKFYTNAGDGYTYTLSKNGSTEEEEGITFDENGEFTINVLAQDITTQYVIKVYGEDKTQPIQTVTYGVSTYCIRMQETETPQGELYVASYYYGVAVQQYGAKNAASVQG